MHQQDIVVQILSGTVDGIDVICLIVDRILYEREVDRQLQGMAVVHQYRIVVAGRDYDFRDPRFGNKPQLARKDSLMRRNLRHAFRMFRGQDAHTRTQTGIKNQSFHKYPPYYPYIITQVIYS